MSVFNSMIPDEIVGPLFNKMPVTGNNFTVFIGGMPISFSKIYGITLEIETEAFVEGGRNDFVHTLMSGVTTERTLTMERGYGAAAIPLLTESLTVGTTFPFIFITVLDDKFRPRKVYCAINCMLKSYSTSDLDALSGQYAIEKFEFVYEKIKTVKTIPLL